MFVSRCLEEVQIYTASEWNTPSQFIFNYIPVLTEHLLGMGDQIKRYCEKLEREEYDEVVDNEARLEAEEIYTDLNCYPTQDRGREVSVCRCHTDKCNASPHLSTPSTSTTIIIISASFWWLKYL